MNYCHGNVRFYKIICFVLVFCCNSTPNIAQQTSYAYLNFSTLDGFPSDRIYDVCTDREGNIWLATNHGVCKYNGNRFKYFTIREGLAANEVFSLFCDTKNRIWVRSLSDQLNLIEHDKVYNLTKQIQSIGIQPGRKHFEIVEDEHGNIWMTTMPFNLYKLEPSGRIKHWDMKHRLGNCAKSILSGNYLYFLTDSIFSRIHVDSEKWTFYQNYPSLRINDFKSLGNSTIAYIDTANQLHLLPGKDLKKNFKSTSFTYSLHQQNQLLFQLSREGLIKHDLKSSDKKSVHLSGYTLSDAESDLYGNLWVATLNHGIFKLKVNNFPILTSDLNGIRQSFHACYVDNRYLIVGNSIGDIYIYDRSQLQIIRKIQLEHRTSLNTRILKIVKFKDKILVATDIGAYSVEYETFKIHCFFPNQACKNIFSQGSEVYVLNNVGINIFNEHLQKVREIRIEERFYSYVTYGNKQIFGSQNAIYHLQNNELHQFLHLPLQNYYTDLLKVDSLLFCATNERGVIMLHQSKPIGLLNKSTGLSSDNCRKLLRYQHEIFIATHNGINRYNLQNGNVQRIMESEGLSTNSVNDMAIFNDTLYSATDQGVSVIPLGYIQKRPEFKFYLSPVSINTDTIWNSVNQIKCHFNDQISLEMNAISLGVKGNVEYYYRLAGKDNKFINTRESVLHLNLPEPGKYRFESYARDNHQEISQWAVLNIQVIPYWWQTTYFRIMALLVIIACMFAVLRIIQKYLELDGYRIEQLEGKVKRLEIEAWKANINPHFLFNAFNTIQSLFNDDHINRAQEFIRNLSVVLRKTIDNSGKLFHTFDEEITYLHSYIQLEQIKHLGDLDYSINYDTVNLKQYYIPTLIIQPLVENSIKHVFGQQRKGLIQINFTLRPEGILVEVLDNGPGLKNVSSGSHQSRGLLMIREKLRIIENSTGKRIQFSIMNRVHDDGSVYGVHVSVLLPAVNHGNFFEQ